MGLVGVDECCREVIKYLIHYAIPPQNAQTNGNPENQKKKEVEDMFCRHCGQEQEAGVKFCANCGAALEEPAEVTPVAEVAETPAAEAVEAPAAEVAEAPVAEAASAPILTGKGNGLIAALAIGAVALIAVVALLFVLVGSLFGGSQTMVAFVDESGELQFRPSLKEDADAVEVTDGYVGSVAFSADGKEFYYTENNALYAVKTPVTKKSKPQRIKRDVSSFKLLPTGKLLFWDYDGDCKVYDGKETYSLLDRDDGRQVGFSENWESLYYEKTDNKDRKTLYKVDVKKNAKAATVLEDYYQLYSDYNADVLVYVGKRDQAKETKDIYSCKPGGKGTELVSGVSGVWGVAKDKAEFYYMKANQAEAKLYDLVDDDMASADQATLSGVAPAYPDRYDYFFDDYEDLGTAVRYMARNGEERVVAYDPTEPGANAFSAARQDAESRYAEDDAIYQEWQRAEERESLREYLKGVGYVTTSYDLYFYNGKDSDTPVASGVRDRISNGAGVTIYRKAAEKNLDKVITMSELSEYGDSYYDNYDLGEQVRIRAEDGDSGSDNAWYVCVGGKESQLDLSSGANVNSMLVLEGKEAVLAIYDRENSKSLVAYAIKNGTLEELGEVAGDDYRTAGVGNPYAELDSRELSESDVLYFYDGRGENVDFMEYRAGYGGKARTVMEDVVAGEVYRLEDGSVYAKTGSYELSRATKDGAEEIVDDVGDRTIFFLGNGKLLYVSDNDDLMYYDGKTSVRLERNVRGFVPSGPWPVCAQYY